ncbi:MAG: glycoside hydrolase family 1 protein [Candidatus Dormibacteraeota bacterium]|nr:glycoside hydrolase family 1 protein [Candidatus Dormibacteraeota bacterium]
MTFRQFPDRFLWGTATAAHQVEGGNHANDWWSWEQVAGHIKNGDTSDRACEHYGRYASDFDLLRSLHQNAHRLSVEWSRIEPSPGEFSPVAIAHYRDVLQALRDRGMEPLVTLHHFTNPTWIAQAGGWDAPATAEYFARFAQRVADELGTLVRFWITINEPTVVAYQGYVRGEWPPGTRNLGAATRALVNLLRGHWMAYERIKSRHPDHQIGLAHHLRIFDPSRAYMPQDRLVAAAFNRIFNETILKSLRLGRLVFPLTRAGRDSGPRQSQDFIGLNYYTRELVRFNHRFGAELFGERMLPADAPRSELNWELYPEGLYRTLRSLERERLPIYVTENGIADSRDAIRPEYLLTHISAMQRAIQAGSPVRGYFHWTCFDNFEWAEGYSAKFGLIACDPLTQERRPRPSARLYAQICLTNQVPASVELLPAAQQPVEPAGPPDLR